MVDKNVGCFSIEDEIGRGSFATVYRGQHKATGALVAVKSVNLSKLNKKLKENLYTEIDILKGLHHPHAVALIDCRESNTHIYLVMEYCELGDLSYFIRKRDSLGEHEALRDMVRRYPMPPVGGLPEVIVRHFLKQLASALEFLRARNFIHRDVKPQNLLIIPSPEFLANARERPVAMKGSASSLQPKVGLISLPMLKIADFGFARSLPSASLAETLCGSPLYMAPEILRFEKYDAKADLWSVGAVLFEMMTAKPPFRASNHVELLRKIEQSNDFIRFPKDVAISPQMKDIIKALLKRTPTVRMSFERFFEHPAVVDTIPELAREDYQKDIPVHSKIVEKVLHRNTSIKGEKKSSQNMSDFSHTSSKERNKSPPSGMAILDSERNMNSSARCLAQQVRLNSMDHKRPIIVSSTTTPNMKATTNDQAQFFTHGTVKDKIPNSSRAEDVNIGEAIAEAEQAVRDAREYVLVEKRAVEVNAFADEMAANPRLQNNMQTWALKTEPLGRRATTSGIPNSTDDLSISPPRAAQNSKGKSRQENIPQPSNSQGKLSSSPSVTSAISRALNSASLRVFGVSYPDVKGKGISQNIYNLHNFSSYPMSPSAIIFIGDGRSSKALDEDQRCLNEIEESATRSDVVFGFAEVKYKQLVPSTPSIEYGLGGSDNCKEEYLLHEDEGLTIEAIVSLSEEALVLYIKALSLLAKSMDIARAWWSRKSRGEFHHGQQSSNRSDTPSNTGTTTRINQAIQWVRNRFNEVFEKAELISLKLLDAQKQLPEDHPAYLNPASLGSTNVNHNIILTSGVTAEKLMYDRAIDMSRSAAICELANEDIDGCERSYITAVRMLEAVLEFDAEPSLHLPKKRSGNSKDTTAEKQVEFMNGIDLADQQAVLKVISMIKIRLNNLQRKKNLIARHSYSSQPD
ncbi:Serine/threonine-protein kinase ATG1 [Erysiphe necator]|uniref:Serine/threonine-protein kinase ATG1 n=1 Tax=Uncinula necator TaxID=52586 RepID=A0A0B1NWS6_UNCNE|nr:Serine/threonine-protein kinase ATG1 [Erysiphe necator]KHJ30423.1 putative serine threonine protein kinase [Erysiphe necator]